MCKLTRNYYKHPLKYGEYPDFKDMQYLYITLNLVPIKLAVALNTTIHKIKYCIKIFNLHKTKEQIAESRKIFWQSSSEQYKQNRKQQIKNGLINMDYDKKQKMLQNQIKANRDPVRIKNRIKVFKETWSKRTSEQIQQRKDRISAANQNLSEEQKLHKSNKFRQSFAKTWGAKTPEQKKSYINKMQYTKKCRGTLNISNQENKCFDLLVSKFGDVKRQYKSNVYPFYCDFYIPSVDLYIELNFHWTHGNHLFNANNQQDLNLLQIWRQKAKTSKFYQNAIRIWTQKDPEKFKIVKQNNLNFLSFYNLKQFDNWIKELL